MTSKCSIAIGAALLLIAAATPSIAAAPSTTRKAPALSKAAPQPAAKPVATMNGEAISVPVFTAYVNSVLKTRGPQKETAEQREGLARRFIQDWSLSRKAAREGLTKDIEGKLFESRLEILSNFYKKRYIFDKVTVTKAELEQAVGQVDDEFYLSQITVADEETARKVYDEAVAGRDFRELASRYSIGLSSGTGGGMGLVTKSDPRYDDAQKRVIFSLTPGAVTKPFEHTLGWAVVRVDRVDYGTELKKQRMAEVEGSLRDTKERQPRRTTSSGC